LKEKKERKKSNEGKRERKKSNEGMNERKKDRKRKTDRKKERNHCACMRVPPWQSLVAARGRRARSRHYRGFLLSSGQGWMDKWMDEN